MTTIAFANVTGQLRGDPFRLPPARPRRLSAVVRRHAPKGRAFIVSVHRATDGIFVPTAGSVRLRREWKDTLVGRDRVVLITLLPRGGGSRGAAGAGGGGGKSGVSIGLAVASIALIGLAPFTAGLSTALLGPIGAMAVQGGLVIGGLALSYAAQRSRAAGGGSDARPTAATPVYSVSGGGNLPRPGQRKPDFLGRCWLQPPLSQGDVTIYQGQDQLLLKRMTLCLGKARIHTIRLGSAGGPLYWSDGSIPGVPAGLQPPFDATAFAYGAGGSTSAGADPASGVALTEYGPGLEVLYEQPSAIMPGDVLSNPDVAAIELPRFDRNPGWTVWHRAQPPGQTVDRIQLDFQFPRGISSQDATGKPISWIGQADFVAQPIDPLTGDPIGGEIVLLRYNSGRILTTTALRQTQTVTVPEGAYRVRARNAALQSNANTNVNDVLWDGLRGIKDDVRIRPLTTEIVMGIRSGAGLSITAFSDVWVEATKIGEYWDGAAWVEGPIRKAVHGYGYLVRAPYHLADPNGADTDAIQQYAAALTEHDEYNGPLPDVGSFWSVANTVLGVIRAQAVKVGAIHSLVRDESHAARRHVVSRRQIVRDSGQAEYELATEDGAGDVIVEFDRGGDPTQPDEVRATIGSPSRTPKRYRIAGVTTGEQALRLARWLAAVSVYRGDTRVIGMEWDGSLIYPGDRVFSDVWFLDGQQVAGVESWSGSGPAGGPRLLLDVPTEGLSDADWTYGCVRTRKGREWGLLRMRAQGPRALELHPEDVASLAGSTGLALPAVLARDGQQPTTIVIGELAELQRTYVARSAVPTGPDQARVEMVGDDPRVWQFLGEEIVLPEPPDPGVASDPLVPDAIASLVARCNRIETGIEVAWGVTPSRGAHGYIIELSYDTASFERIYAGEATRGRKTIHQSDDPVTVRAKAIGRTGLETGWITTTFTTQAPVVRGALLGNGEVLLGKLEAEVQDLLSDDPTVPGSIGEAKQHADDAKQDADEARKHADDALARGNAAYQAAQDIAADAAARAADLARAFSTSPGVRSQAKDAAARALAESLRLLTDAVADIQFQFEQHRQEVIQAGLTVDSAQGIAELAGLAVLRKETQTQLNEVKAKIDAVAVQLTLVASVGQVGDLSGLVEALSQARIELNAVQGSLTSYVTQAQLTSEAKRTSTLEQRMGAAEGRITTIAETTDVGQVATRLTALEEIFDTIRGDISRSITALSTATYDLPLSIDSLGLGLEGLREQLGSLDASVAIAHDTIGAKILDNGDAVSALSSELGAAQRDTEARFFTMAETTATLIDAETRRREGLAAQVNDKDTGLLKTRADLASEIYTRSAQYESAANRLLSLEASTTSPSAGGILARLILEENVRSTLTTSAAYRLGLLEASINVGSTPGGLLARLITEENVRTSLTDSAAFRLAVIEASIGNPGTPGGVLARILAEENTSANRAFALAQQINDVYAAYVNGYNNLDARAVAEVSTRASETEALAIRAASLEASINIGTTPGGLLARLIAEENVRASLTDSAAFRLGALEASINIGTTPGGLLARLITEERVRTSLTDAAASRLALLEASTGNASAGGLLARLIAEESVRTTQTYALGNRTLAIEASLGDPNAGGLLAFVNQVNAVKVDALGAISAVMGSQVGIRADAASAGGRFTMAAYGNGGGGLVSRIGFEANVSPDSGSRFAASLYLDAYQDGRTEVLIRAGALKFFTPYAIVAPFSVDENGVTHIDNAVIRRGDISQTKIAFGVPGNPALIDFETTNAGDEITCLLIFDTASDQPGLGSCRMQIRLSTGEVIKAVALNSVVLSTAGGGSTRYLATPTAAKILGTGGYMQIVGELLNAPANLGSVTLLCINNKK